MSAVVVNLSPSNYTVGGVLRVASERSTDTEPVTTNQHTSELLIISHH